MNPTYGHSQCMIKLTEKAVAAQAKQQLKKTVSLDSVFLAEVIFHHVGARLQQGSCQPGGTGTPTLGAPSTGLEQTLCLASHHQRYPPN